MKNLLFYMTIATLLLTVSCKSTFNASETLQNDENRKELYQTIISDSSKFSELLDVADNNKDAQMLLMKNHMKMMEDGKMMEMMKENLEMKNMMMKKMMEKMQENPEMMKKMMEKMQENPEMRKQMMEKMKENPEMMKMMMEKMQANPEMMKKMKEMEMKDKKHSGHQ